MTIMARRYTKLGILAAGLLATTAAALADPVTYDRLLNPEPENWLNHNRTFDGHRYSPLDEINTGNVANLHMAFALPLIPQIPGARGGGMQGTPRVDDGIMYMVDGVGVVYRIDVTSGRQGYINWMMDPETDPEIGGLFNNKGVALLGDNVYSITREGYLLATNAASGELVWQVDTQQDPDEDFTMAPVALDGKLIMGPRGDSPMRGRLEARSAVDGSQLWQFWSVPAPGEPGGETWPVENDAYLVGGSGFWVEGTYDPETNILYYGTANPDPTSDPSLRPGDNLYSSSTVALNADTGELVWYYQFVPQDQWDYDENGTNQVIKTDSGTRIGHFGRDGFAYILDASNGDFIKATQYVDEVNWTAGLDPKTGKPVEYNPDLAAGGFQVYPITPRRVLDGGPLALAGITPAPEICPNIQGGNNHWPTSYSDRTGLMYATAIEGCNLTPADPTRLTTGSVVAVNADGDVVNKVHIPFAPYGGQLTTAGKLLFASMTNGDFFAMDDTTLETLWSINLGSPIEAPPITYAVNGKQYIALPVASSIVVGHRYARQGDDPNAASLANIQRTWTLYFFTL